MFPRLFKNIGTVSFCLLALFLFVDSNDCGGTHTIPPNSSSTAPPAQSLFAYLQSGNYQLVIETANQISENSTSFPEARLYLGIARLALAQSNNSQEALNSAVKDLLFVRDNFYAHNNLQPREQFLLNRALMVASLISIPSDINQANDYFSQAITFVKNNANLKEAVYEEYQKKHFNTNLIYQP